MEQEVPAFQNLDNSPLMSNSFAVSHRPEKFIFDFRGVYEQYSPDNKPVVVINHKAILLDPFGAKEFLSVLTDNIKKYESKFGEIKKPTELVKAEKEMAKMQKQAVTSSESQSYMG